ncbi:hypothetical protein LSAT2_023879 [Lamellibrachia satsuma]|nr:hypothetical protein LSAT2_023879 [Lamellibrachia satsuma]
MWLQQPYGGSTQSLGSMNSLENETMEDFFRPSWTTADPKRPVSPEPKIQDLDLVSGAKLLDNKEARQKINVKPRKTRPGSRHTRARTASPQQKAAPSLALVEEEPQPKEPKLSPSSVPAAKDMTEEAVPRPVRSTSPPDTQEVIVSPVKEVIREEAATHKEESAKSEKETAQSTETPVEPKPKQRDELRVTQVRRAPSERIGKAVQLRENCGTQESKVKRRMVSSDGSSLEERHSAQLNQEPFGWLASRQKRNALETPTGSKTSLEPKGKTEDEQANVVKVQDVKLREKSGPPDDKTKRRISSDGSSVEDRHSARPISMQEPLGWAAGKKDDSQKTEDTTTSRGATEFSQMFNKLRHMSKKVKVPTEEKENSVLKTAPKEAAVVVTSPQKPQLEDTDSNASKPTIEEPAKGVSMAVTKPKTVFVIEKSEPKSSKLEPPAEDTVVKRSSPLFKDRSRRQTLPASPSLVRVLSPEKEGEKVKRSASQRKQPEPSVMASSPPSSSGGSLVRASTVAQPEPKKLSSNEDTSSGGVPPWAAMARKKTSKFEQNMKLKASGDAKSESASVAKSADRKPDPIVSTTTEPAASVTHAATKPAVSTTKPAVSSTPTKPAVSSTPMKHAVSSTPAKPVGSVMRAPGSTTVFAKSIKSNTPTTNVVDTNKNNDENKGTETILAPDKKEFSGNRKSRVLDMVKNWQTPQGICVYGYAPVVYGYAPVVYGYAPVVCGYAPVVCGYAPVVCGYTPVVCGYAPVVCGYAPVVCGYAPVVYGYAPA